MFRPLALFIGLRYTRAERSNRFISFISLISMIGLTLGVAVLITVLSVMNGFDRELKTRILGMVPQATVTSAEVISDWQPLADRIKAEDRSRSGSSGPLYPATRYANSERSSRGHYGHRYRT